MKEHKEGYKEFTTTNFVNDDFFLHWVKEKDAQTELFWQEWQKEYPDRVHILQEAIELVKEIHKVIDASNPEFTRLESNKNYQYIEGKIGKRSKVFFLRRMGMVAAGMLLLVLSLFYFLRNQNQVNEKIIAQTGFGETKQIELPDGSKVILNANSQLTYQIPWKQDNPRTLTLQGEAFFQVKKNPESFHKNFIVHTNELDVEVLGTTFNVNSRKKKTRVTLNSGKVKVSDQKTNTILSIPGEMATSTQKGIIQKEKVNLKEKIAWKDNLLFFDQSSYEDVFRILEENYGYKVVVKDSSFLSQEFVGTYPSNKVNLLILTLSKVLTIEQNDSTLIIKDLKE